MILKKIYNIDKFIDDLKQLDYEVFYTKGSDKGTIKLYEDKKQIIYINYNYKYIDIITK